MSHAGTHISERRKHPLSDMEREMTSPFNKFVTTVAVGAALVGASVQAFAVTATGPLTTPPSVLVFDQKLVSGGVEVKYANIPSKGYVAVLGSDAPTNAAPTATVETNLLKKRVISRSISDSGCFRLPLIWVPACDIHAHRRTQCAHAVSTN